MEVIPDSEDQIHQHLNLSVEKGISLSPNLMSFAVSKKNSTLIFVLVHVMYLMLRLHNF
jgi:hypothetical protein